MSVSLKERERESIRFFFLHFGSGIASSLLFFPVHKKEMKMFCKIFFLKVLKFWKLLLFCGIKNCCDKNSGGILPQGVKNFEAEFLSFFYNLFLRETIIKKMAIIL